MTNGRTAQEILNSPEALRLREKRARLVAERSAALAEEQSRWDAEIATLERRTRTEIEEIDLGNGDTIAVWACLSADENRLLNYLQRAQAEIVAGRETRTRCPKRTPRPWTRSSGRSSSWSRPTR
jgi:hypothetical protein